MKEPQFPFPETMCPSALAERLMAIAKDASHNAGYQAAKANILWCDEIAETLALSLCTGFIVAALDLLHSADKWKADPEVAEWLARNPKQP